MEVQRMEPERGGESSGKLVPKYLYMMYLSASAYPHLRSTPPFMVHDSCPRGWTLAESRDSKSLTLSGIDAHGVGEYTPRSKNINIESDKRVPAGKRDLVYRTPDLLHRVQSQSEQLQQLMRSISSPKGVGPWRIHWGWCTTRSLISEGSIRAVTLQIT